MLVYDFEVFKHDWLCVVADLEKREFHTIVNDREKLFELYETHINDVWVGYNNKHYDQYVMKGILLGINPKKINDWIIEDGKEGWQFSTKFNQIPMINYDVMPNPPVGLKTLEGFLGDNVKESKIDFRVERCLTQEEIEETIKYCRYDVEETLKILSIKQADFNAMFDIVKEFKLPLKQIGNSEARITADVLGCKHHDYNDEFDYYFFDCLRIKKYSQVVDWFKNAVLDCKTEMWKQRTLSKPWEYYMYNADDPYWFSKFFYKRSLEIMVAGVPHSFGFGGLHGAPDKPIHEKGLILHVDVNNYYPSMLIAHGIVTRSAKNDNYKLVYNKRKEMKKKQVEATTKEERKMWKKKQLPYKKMLNALSGGMKDKTNPAYDPRNNNIMCINGQLMLLDLIEHLEVVEGFKLLNSNTDGLIIKIPDTDEAFNQVDDICYEWEQRCSTSECEIKLELDVISEIYQKDVNNYLWIDSDGGVERIGAYVKELSRIDYDLPIVNKALVNYMVHGIPVESTINSCNELIQFQKIVKLSDKYEFVEHNGIHYRNKCYRVFASNVSTDGKILKCRRGSNPAKFGNTPDKCFIFNEDVNSLTVPEYLDRDYYIDITKERLKQFGVND